MCRYLAFSLSILVGFSAVAADQAVSQENSPDCSSVLQRLKGALEQPGTAPEFQQTVGDNVSVRFEKTKKMVPKEDCLQIEGHFSDSGQRQAPPKEAKIYAFFKVDPYYPPDKTTIKVGPVEKRDGKTFINLIAKRDYVYTSAGYIPDQRRSKEINKKVVWLEPLKVAGGQETVFEVVLCEMTCDDIVKTKSKRQVNPPPGAQNTGKLPVPPQKAAPDKTSAYSQINESGPAAAGPGTAVTEPPAPPEKTPKLPAERDAVTKAPGNAAIEHLDAKIDIKVLDEAGAQLRILPKIVPCIFDGKAETARDILRSWSKECVSFDPRSGYEISFETLDLSGIPTITFRQKSTKPLTVSMLRITVRMNDSTPVTMNCTVNYTIENADGKPESGFFNNPPPTQSKKDYFLQAQLNKPVAWRNGTLKLSAFKGADCEPEESTYSRQIDDQMVSADGAVVVKNIELRSTLGEALIVLNAYSGIPPSNGSSSTDQYYPVNKITEYREIGSEIMKRIFEKLKGQVKTVKVISNSEQGLYSNKKTFNLTENDRTESKQLGALFHLAPKNFDLSSMKDYVIRYEEENKRPFKYKIFIGQSGLEDQENYCEEFAKQLRDRVLGDRVYFYTFSAVNNVKSPKDADLPPDTKNFPTMICPQNPAVTQTILFPEGKRAGWITSLDRIVNLGPRIQGE